MHFSSGDFYERKDTMASFMTEWYAVVLVTATENLSEPSENRYTTHTKILAIHNDEMIIKEYACELSEGYGLSYREDYVDDLVANPHDCIGLKTLAIDKYNLGSEAVKDFEARHCILGRSDFKLQIPESIP